MTLKGTVQMDYPNFYNNTHFSLTEAICLISGDHPLEVAEYYGNLGFEHQFSSFVRAEQVILAAVERGELARKAITAQQLKDFLTHYGYEIAGFNMQMDLV